MTIFRIPGGKPVSPIGADLNGDGVVSWWEKGIFVFKTTIYFFIGALVFLHILYISACGMFHVGWTEGREGYTDFWGWFILGISGSVGIAFFSWRMATPERGERRAKADLEHQRRMQDIEYDRGLLELDNLRGVADHEPGATYSQLDIDAVARAILLNYYQGKPFSRDKMVAAGTVKKSVWDKANALLLSRGIRKGNYMIPEDYLTAVDLYMEGSQKAQKREWKGGGLIDTR